MLYNVVGCNLCQVLMWHAVQLMLALFDCTYNCALLSTARLQRGQLVVPPCNLQPPHLTLCFMHWPCSRCRLAGLLLQASCYRPPATGQLHSPSLAAAPLRRVPRPPCRPLPPQRSCP
jgi:hypothetical protein